MRVDMPLALCDDQLASVSNIAIRAEEAGLDGVSFGEMASDPILHMTVAAGATTRVRLMTNIIVAFARSPMVLAMQGRNIQEYSNGRLMLGLGTQIKPHIERRFSMPWSSPAARMAEYIAALHAIWNSWATGDRLDFRGDFYTHTLMTPVFTPTSTCPAPKILLAAVGERMTRTAGAVADGILIHPFSTSRYLREVTLPAVDAARTQSSTSAAEFDVVSTAFLVTGRTEEELDRSRRTVRAQIAFYGSTPAYRPVLALHGWDELADELNRLSTTRDPERWQTMADLVDDEVLAEFSVAGTPEEVGRAVVDRYGDVVTRIEINHIGIDDPDVALEVGRAIRTSASESTSA